MTDATVNFPGHALLVALPSPVYRAILGFVPPAVVRLLAERRVLLAEGGDPDGPADAFEHWLVERTLKAARSEAFRETAEYEYLMAEWERGR